MKGVRIYNYIYIEREIIRLCINVIDHVDLPPSYA